MNAPRHALPPTVAIDGPVASGKTTVGLELARRLGCRFVDTGAMYRALTWAALQRGLDFSDEAALEALASQVEVEVTPVSDDAPAGRLLVDGVDVTDQLRTPEVERHVSLLARVPGVRRVMVHAQREMAARGGVVMVGRDIGTVVLPEAPVKVYLEASVTERARRRHAEVASSSGARPYADVLAELERRDELDTARTDSPLRPAEDAHVLRTDGLTIAQVVDAIAALVEARYGRKR